MHAGVVEAAELKTAEVNELMERLKTTQAEIRSLTAQLDLPQAVVRELGKQASMLAAVQEEVSELTAELERERQRSPKAQEEVRLVGLSTNSNSFGQVDLVYV